MFELTTHLRQEEQRTHDQRKRDVVLVTVIGLCAIVAGAAISAMNALGWFVVVLPP
jgi:hypothetical protein